MVHNIRKSSVIDIEQMDHPVNVGKDFIPLIHTEKRSCTKRNKEKVQDDS